MIGEPAVALRAAIDSVVMVLREELAARGLELPAEPLRLAALAEVAGVWSWEEHAAWVVGEGILRRLSGGIVLPEREVTDLASHVTGLGKAVRGRSGRGDTPRIV